MRRAEKAAAIKVKREEVETLRMALADASRRNLTTETSAADGAMGVQRNWCIKKDAIGDHSRGTSHVLTAGDRDRPTRNERYLRDSTAPHHGQIDSKSDALSYSPSKHAQSTTSSPRLCHTQSNFTLECPGQKALTALGKGVEDFKSLPEEHESRKGSGEVLPTTPGTLPEGGASGQGRLESPEYEIDVCHSPEYVNSQGAHEAGEPIANVDKQVDGTEEKARASSLSLIPQPLNSSGEAIIDVCKRTSSRKSCDKSPGARPSPSFDEAPDRDHPSDR